MERDNSCQCMKQPIWKLLVLLGALGFVLASRGTADAQPISTTLQIRLWTTEDEPVAHAAVRVSDATSNQAIAEGTTDTAGEVRFDALPAAAIRVVVVGKRPDGTPLKQVGQDAQGLWARLPARDWTMDLRADIDGTVFPDLGITGGGAVDGLDATAIADGASGLPTLSSAAAFPLVPTRPAVVVPDPPAVGRDRVGETGTVPTIQPPVDRTGVVLLVVLGGLTIAVAATIWRGKL